MVNGNLSANTALSPPAAVAHTIAKSANNPPSPTRPFLRRQESHSVVPANNAVFAHNPPHTTRPFLRRQESQRATPFPVAIGGIYLWTGMYRHILPIVPIRHCEIPAFAGMVFLMDSARKKTISNPPNVCAQLLKFSHHVFITAVKMINAVNDTFAVCRQGGDD